MPHVPFPTESKVDTKPYADEEDATKLNQWIQ